MIRPFESFPAFLARVRPNSLLFEQMDGSFVQRSAPVVGEVLSALVARDPHRFVVLLKVDEELRFGGEAPPALAVVALPGLVKFVDVGRQFRRRFASERARLAFLEFLRERVVIGQKMSGQIFDEQELRRAKAAFHHDIVEVIFQHVILQKIGGNRNKT